MAPLSTTARLLQSIILSLESKRRPPVQNGSCLVVPLSSQTFVISIRLLSLSAARRNHPRSHHPLMHRLLTRLLPLILRLRHLLPRIHRPLILRLRRLLPRIHLLPRCRLPLSHRPQRRLLPPSHRRLILRLRRLLPLIHRLPRRLLPLIQPRLQLLPRPIRLEATR